MPMEEKRKILARTRAIVTEKRKKCIDISCTDVTIKLQVGIAILSICNIWKGVQR